jgi:hypothetical protein
MAVHDERAGRARVITAPVEEELVACAVEAAGDSAFSVK